MPFVVQHADDYTGKTHLADLRHVVLHNLKIDGAVTEIAPAWSYYWMNGYRYPLPSQPQRSKARRQPALTLAGTQFYAVSARMLCCHGTVDAIATNFQLHYCYPQITVKNATANVYPSPLGHRMTI
ncbi:hypothetical protein D3C80_1620630 [compost metagenome]